MSRSPKLSPDAKWLAGYIAMNLRAAALMRSGPDLLRNDEDMTVASLELALELERRSRTKPGPDRQTDARWVHELVSAGMRRHAAARAVLAERDIDAETATAKSDKARNDLIEQHKSRRAMNARQLGISADRVRALVKQADDLHRRFMAGETATEWSHNPPPNKKG